MLYLVVVLIGCRLVPAIHGVPDTWALGLGCLRRRCVRGRLGPPEEYDDLNMNFIYYFINPPSSHVPINTPSPQCHAAWYTSRCPRIRADWRTFGALLCPIWAVLCSTCGPLQTTTRTRTPCTRSQTMRPSTSRSVCHVCWSVGLEDSRAERNPCAASAFSHVGLPSAWHCVVWRGGGEGG